MGTIITATGNLLCNRPFFFLRKSFKNSGYTVWPICMTLSKFVCRASGRQKWLSPKLACVLQSQKPKKADPMAKLWSCPNKSSQALLFQRATTSFPSLSDLLDQVQGETLRISVLFLPNKLFPNTAVEKNSLTVFRYFRQHIGTAELDDLEVSGEAVFKMSAVVSGRLPWG